jgi:hypothetical protein
LLLFDFGYYFNEDNVVNRLTMKNALRYPLNRSYVIGKKIRYNFSFKAIKIKILIWGQHWSILTFDVSRTLEFYMQEISSMDFPQHGEAFLFLWSGFTMSSSRLSSIEAVDQGFPK